MPLITFLAQIRDGYIARDFSVNTKFPSSMALVGMRDIRDYVIHVHPDAASTGLTSPFNIKKEALTLANFTQGEIETLYKQHTEASGQIFEPDAIERAWYWTEGQPCLVNALAYEVICKILTKDYQIPVTAMLIDQAAETIIKRRDTHIDSLLEHLKEARVARVMDSIFASTVSYVSSTDDDRQYCIDLGLVVSNEQNELRPSNAIYREVIVRVITDEIQHVLNKTIPDFPWTNGQVILMTELLKEFQKYWRKGSLSFPNRKRNFIASHYDEALYSFILESFLQRLVNGQAVVLRQFAEGRGAVDIGISYNKREYIVEVEIKSNKSLNDSLTQLAKYLDANGEQEGWLVIFDRNINRSWDKKITWNTVEFQGKSIHIVGC
jgi:hypothetical protein